MSTQFNNSQSYLVKWDTRYRISGTASNAVLPIVGNSIYISRIEVVQLEMFNSWYAANPLNYVIDFDDGGGPVQAIIQPGNYNRINFPAMVKLAMEAVSATTFTVSIDQASGRLTILGTAPFNLLFATGALSPPPTSKSYTIDKMLGFARADTGFAAAQVGAFPVNLSGENYIYFTSSLVNGRDNAIIAAGNTDIAASGNGIFHMAQIFTTQASVTETNTSYKQVYVGATTTNFDVQVRYNDGNIVDLNGFDYSMLVRIYFA